MACTCIGSAHSTSSRSSGGWMCNTQHLRLWSSKHSRSRIGHGSRTLEESSQWVELGSLEGIPCCLTAFWLFEWGEYIFLAWIYPNGEYAWTIKLVLRLCTGSALGGVGQINTPKWTLETHSNPFNCWQPRVFVPILDPGEKWLKGFRAFVNLSILPDYLCLQLYGNVV